MRPHIDIKASENENKDQCVIGFDIWGTLLDLEQVLRVVARNIAYTTGVDLNIAAKKIFLVHEEARKIRRRKPEIHPLELLDISRKLLAEVFNTHIEKIDRSIESAFETATTDVLYDDVAEALKALSNAKIEMGIIGNVLFWPSTFTKLLLEKLSIRGYFKLCVFSDEVGISKPDRKIFLLFAEKMKIDPSRIIYVGDNVIEDVSGALSSGGVGVLISRSISKRVYVPELRVALINRLTDLLEVYDLFCK